MIETNINFLKIENKEQLNIVSTICRNEFGEIYSDSIERVFNGEKLGCIDINNYIVLYDGSIIGTIGYYIHPNDKDSIWLSWFVIEPRYRGRGIGYAVLNEFMNNIMSKLGKSIYRVYTDESRLPAINIYKKMGYKIEPDDNWNNPRKYSAIILTKGDKLWLKEPIW